LVVEGGQGGLKAGEDGELEGGESVGAGVDACAGFAGDGCKGHHPPVIAALAKVRLSLVHQVQLEGLTADAAGIEDPRAVLVGLGQDTVGVQAGHCSRRELEWCWCECGEVQSEGPDAARLLWLDWLG